VFEGEGLSSFYDTRKATVSARGDDFTGIKTKWRSAVGASDFMDNRQSEHLDYLV
jgi:hypothetical protein